MAKHAAPKGSTAASQEHSVDEIQHFGRFAAPGEQNVARACEQLARLDDNDETGIVALYAAATYLRQVLSEAYLNGEADWTPAGKLSELAGGAEGERDRRRMREATDALREAKTVCAHMSLPSLSVVYDELPLLSGVLLGGAVLLLATKLLAGNVFGLMLVIHYVVMFATCVAVGVATAKVLWSKLGLLAALLGLAVFGGGGWALQTWFDAHSLLASAAMMATGAAFLVPIMTHNAHEKRYIKATSTLEACEDEFYDAVRDAVLNVLRQCNPTARIMFVPSFEDADDALETVLSRHSLEIRNGRLVGTTNERIERVLFDKDFASRDMIPSSSFWACLVQTCLDVEFAANELKRVDIMKEKGKVYVPRFTYADEAFENVYALCCAMVALTYEERAEAYRQRFGDGDDLAAPAVAWYAKAMAVLPQFDEAHLDKALMMDVPYTLGSYYARGRGVAQQRDLAFELLDWAADHTVDSERLLAISKLYYYVVRDYGRLSHCLSRVVRYELDVPLRQEYDNLAYLAGVWKEFGVKE